MNGHLLDFAPVGHFVDMSIQISRPDATNDTLVGFVQQPDGRGTLSILFSCLLTLSLCIWSAIHLDLPKHDERQFQYALRYLKWSVLGLFGPELVIWAAWRQHISARVLSQSIQEVRGCLIGAKGKHADRSR
jgi:hypothetical protein